MAKPEDSLHGIIYGHPYFCILTPPAALSPSTKLFFAAQFPRKSEIKKVLKLSAIITLIHIH